MNPNKTMKSTFLSIGVALILIVTPYFSSAQSSTDLFLMPITLEDSTLTIGDVVNITNRDGYDNQPLFTPAGDAIYYTSIRNDQADIYKYSLADGSISQVTDTPESEYSPTVMPNGNKFSVVRVSMEGKQHLWSYYLDGSNPEILLPDVEPIGYHIWVNDSLLFAFILGQPMTGEIISYPSQTRDSQILNVGRGMRIITGSDDIVFGIANQLHSDEKYIVAIDLLMHRGVSIVTNTPAGGEDFAFLPDDSILMGNGNHLLRWSRDSPKWQIVHTFDDSIAKISRLDISPDGKWLVLVSDIENIPK